jgi:hypothetical protein
MTSINDFAVNRKADTITCQYAKTDLLMKHAVNQRHTPKL